MRRPLIVVLLAGIALLLAAGAASAHAVLRGSDPASGASLGKAPEKVTLTFTEPADLSLSSVHVLDATGKAVESGKARSVPGKPLAREVPLGQLPNGAYTVSWRTVSRSDGHLTSGSFAFGVGVQPPSASSRGAPAAAGSPSPSILGVAGRWALDWGLILLVGAVASSLLVFRRRESGPPLPLLGGALALSAGGLAAMVVAERSRVGVSIGELLGLRGPRAAGAEPGKGLWAIMRFQHAHAAAGGPHPGPVPVAGPGVAAVGNRESPAAGASSPAAGASSPAPVATAVMAVPDTGDERVLAVERFSRMATVALGVVLLTGLARALVEVRSWHGLVSTSFGRTLLVKLALVAGLVAVGAVNRFRLVPALRVGRAKVVTLGSTVRAELALAIPIVVAAAVLGELPPARYVSQPAAGQRAPAAVTVSGNDFATSVKVELTALPGTVGANRFSARVLDYDSGQPVAADRVSLRFTQPNRPDVGASTLELKRAPDGRWQGEGILSIAGRWSITTLVQRPGGGVTVPLQLEPRAAPATSPQVKTSKAPGQPTVYTIVLQRGSSLQAYLDPGRPGPNVLHLTWFAANGSEQPMFQVRAKATNPAGATSGLSLQRFSAGHLVSNLNLKPGRWSFDVVATSKAGDLSDARFEQVIR